MEPCLKKYTSLFFLGILCCSNLYAQIIKTGNGEYYKQVFVQTDNFGVSYLDTLEDALPKIKNDTIYYKVLNDLAYYWHTRDLKKALDFTEMGLQLTQSKKDTLWNGRFQITQGAVLLRLEQLDSAFSVLQRAKEKVNRKDLPFLNTQLGYVFERRGLLDKAADYAMESLRLGNELNDKHAIALAYSDLSNLFWKQSKFEKGLQYGLKSVKIFEDTGLNDLDYDFTLYVVGNNLLALKREKEALQYFEHAIVIGERYGFYNNLSDIYISLVDLYAFLNEFRKAETAAQQAIKYGELLHNNFLIMRAWLSLGKSQYLEGKYQAAISSLEKCIAVATDDFGDSYFLSQAYNTLGKAYASSHNYRDAYAAFAKYDELKNEIFTAEADQRISLLQTEFDVAQKENTIQLQEALIKKQQTRQTLISIIAVLLFLFLGLLFYMFRANRRKRRLLQRKNEEKEFLLKEIHHRVKNNLEIVSSLLALQAAQKDDSKLTDIMQDTQNRVQAMSMVHQRLYQGKNLSTIEMKNYFENLAHYVLESFGKSDKITIKCEMPPLEVDIDMAIPLGLIVNELLTNALKYAFPSDGRGRITIGLIRNKKENNYHLEFSDNGIGQQMDNRDSKTGFGTKLIDLLVYQLGGKLTKNTKKGTHISFEFEFENAA